MIECKCGGVKRCVCRIVLDSLISSGLSLLLFACEYPRSARRNRGKNVERP